MNNKTPIVLFFLLVSLMFSGCSNGKLTRKKAAKLIEKFYEYPNVETIRPNLNVVLSHTYTSLIQDGYLSVPRYYGLTFPDLNVTEKGASYLKVENEGAYFATNMRKLKEVTSIFFDGEHENYATVEFTCVRYNVTPFGKHQGYKENDEVKYTVLMAKYDDGWRITAQNGKNFTASDFPDVMEFK